MAPVSTRATPALLCRLVLAASLATCLITGGMLADPSTGSAQPKEWDIQVYDDCMDGAREAFVAGDISIDDFDSQGGVCCDVSGGVRDGTGPYDCTAPAVAAGPRSPAPPSEAANPDVPTAAPPSTPGPKPPTPKTPFTLAPIAPLAPVG